MLLLQRWPREKVSLDSTRKYLQLSKELPSNKINKKTVVVILWERQGTSSIFMNNVAFSFSDEKKGSSDTDTESVSVF